MMPWRSQITPNAAARSPYEVFLLCVGVLLGSLAAFGVEVSTTLDASTTNLLARAWGGFLATGCALALFGIARVRSRPYEALVVERAGVLLIGGGALVFAVLAFAGGSHVTALYTGAMNLGFGLASIFRAWQITREFRSARRVYTMGARR